LVFIIIFLTCKYALDNWESSQIGPSLKYVSVCPELLSGDHRLGNHLYLFSAVAYLARCTNRRIAMPQDGWILDNAFETDVTRFSDVGRNLCPCQTLWMDHYDVDKRLLDDAFVERLRRGGRRTLLVCGLSQTFR